jgi:hypothetical protein
MDSRVAAGRFVVSLWRCDEHPGGIDWVDKCTTMILEREATARADALREAAERVRGLAPPLDFDDEERVCDSIFTDKQEGQ